MIKGQFLGKIAPKLANFGGKMPHFLGKLQKSSPPPLARKFEKVHCKGMFFMEIHCTVRARFWKPNFGLNVWSFSDRVPPPGFFQKVKIAPRLPKKRVCCVVTLQSPLECLG